MIEQLNSTNLIQKGYQPKKNNKQDNTAFKGGIVDGVIQGIQYCEKYPMLNVTALDVSTAIAPRTIIESKTNAHAGFEAFRRESSGLIVNCLIPSFVVLGVAKLLEKPFMGEFKTAKMANSWANEDTINRASKYFQEAKGVSQREKVGNTIKNILGDIDGVDGNVDKGGLKSFKNYDLAPEIEKLTDAVFEKDSKTAKKAIKEAYKGIISKTHAAENLKIDGKFISENLESVVTDTPKLLKSFIAENITDTERMLKFTKKAKSLVNAKSLAGLGIIIPLAASMQTINRWITHKTSGQKGAPIYKDFGKTEVKQMTSKDKAELFKQKVISAGSMVGVALMSMTKMPNLKMFQFKGMFPTMDQARLVSTSTFASRMLAAEDKNELKEATVRDIATFSSLYFLGDYAAKGTASLIERTVKEADGTPVKLLNTLKNPSENATKLHKFGNWVKNTALKSSDEVATPLAKKMRSVCQLSNLGFSLALLGIGVPLITRHQTNKKHQAELKAMEEKSKLQPQPQSNFNQYKNFIKSSPSAQKTYKQFFTATK